MKQIAWIYVVLAALAVAFSAVSLAIYFFGPRPLLISKKLKFGALVISFNTLLAGCYTAKDSKESITCYGETFQGTDKAGDTATSDTASKGTDGIPPDTDVECYVSPPPEDTGTAVPSTDSGDSSTDVMCYGPTVETDIACYDTDVPPVETDSGEPPIDTDISCYELPIETDIECYDPPIEYPTDSETVTADGGLGDTNTWETDVECYAMPLEDSDPDGGEEN